MTRCPLTALALVAMALAWPVDAGATVLLFDQARSSTGDLVVPTTAGDPVPQDYGDNVTGSPMDVPGGQYTYGNEGEGFTPNVTVDYFAGAGTPLSLWDSAYGDLENVLFANALPGVSGPLSLNLRLSAEPGYRVRLYGFDLGGWPNADYLIDAVRIANGGGDVLFVQEDLLVEGNFATLPRHTALSFAGPLTAPQLLIQIDFANLAGGSQDNIGIDNVRFGQLADDPQTPPRSVPEPGSLALAAWGLLGLASMTRKSKRG